MGTCFFYYICMLFLKGLIRILKLIYHNIILKKKIIKNVENIYICHQKRKKYLLLTICGM